MKSVWVLLLVTHGCMYEKVSVKGYATEQECIKVLNEGQRNTDFFTDVRGQCESGDALMSETK